MGGRYYKDPTSDMGMANVKREMKSREAQKERLRIDIRRLFERMKATGMNRKEMVGMLKTEYRKFFKINTNS